MTDTRPLGLARATMQRSLRLPTASRGAASPTGAIAAGVSAHAAAAGCLPALVPLVLALPVMLFAIRAVDTALTRCGSALRVAAGQLTVHLTLGVAARCSDHVASSGSHGGGQLDAVMTLAHAGALLGCLTAVSRAEGAVRRLLGGVADRLASLGQHGPPGGGDRHPSPPTCTSTGAAKTASAEGRRPRVTRGPPAFTSAPA